MLIFERDFLERIKMAFDARRTLMSDALEISQLIGSTELKARIGQIFENFLSRERLKLAEI